VPTALHAIVVLVLAIAVDLAVGDPPNRWHPVAWMGRALAGGRRWLCRGAPAALLLGGAALTLAVMALAAGTGALAAGVAGRMEPWGWALEAAALKSTLSIRGLAAAARSVAEALGRGDIDEARRRLGFHLVSRPTAELDTAQVASGAIESVAENLTDALVAPAMFFVLFGLPGAFAYRALNTADTMLGYRQGRLEYFGKMAARLDDLANLLPARLAALALVVAAGRRTASAWSAMLHDHASTASPNAGWTMSATAGALGVTLEKPGAYRLGRGRVPGAADIDLSIRLVARGAVLALGALLTVRLLASKIPYQ
jgi:adenosylcobinamide-phosphate synthase